ncbi:hypothetical protein [Streptomyces profundus]|uniref:hypothetical protein n=1 Tax=Streptomyces profundus TaxID=2867410 RepID=UPI001D16EB6B|nr:hypothetical protein [Streptomyces sp. MA3_2.13]UED84967.1 hypothetical protein K4G22_12765 [Streptomyces sp. MA3_2.13]
MRSRLRAVIIGGIATGARTGVPRVGCHAETTVGEGVRAAAAVLEPWRPETPDGQLV